MTVPAGSLDEPLLRPALPADTAALDLLIAASARGLGIAHYAAEETEAAIAHIFGVDSALIADGTYFVIADQDGAILGCGGWSRFRTLFGGDRYAARSEGLLDPAVDAARIRAFFVAPQAARQGLATRLLTASETAAQAAGFARATLMATLPGVPFYAARGYVARDPIDLSCGDRTVSFVPMDKNL